MSYRNDYTVVWETNVPSDTVAVNYYGLLITVTGNVVAQSVAGTDISFPSVPAYTIIPGKFVLVKTTGTTATVLGGKAY